MTPTKKELNKWLAESFLGWKPNSIRTLCDETSEKYWTYSTDNPVYRHRSGLHNDIYILPVGQEDFFNPEGLATIKAECNKKIIRYTHENIPAKKLFYTCVRTSGELKGCENACEYTTFYIALFKALEED